MSCVANAVDRDERPRPECVEHVYILGSSVQRFGLTVDLVDNHDIDHVLIDVSEKKLPCRPLHRTAEKSAKSSLSLP